MSDQAQRRTVGRRPPADIKEHAVYVIDEKIDEWRHLHKALAAAEEKVREHQDRHPNSMGHIRSLEADVRLLQDKCDRALEALGAAVAARRALAAPERPYPAMES